MEEDCGMQTFPSSIIKYEYEDTDDSFHIKQETIDADTVYQELPEDNTNKGTEIKTEVEEQEPNETIQCGHDPRCADGSINMKKETIDADTAYWEVPEDNTNPCTDIKTMGEEQEESNNTINNKQINNKHKQEQTNTDVDDRIDIKEETIDADTVYPKLPNTDTENKTEVEEQEPNETIQCGHDPRCKCYKACYVVLSRDIPGIDNYSAPTKPYRCKFRFCNKSFTCSKVTRHERTHTGERPYKCKLCNKSFSQSNNRNHHQRTHTGERPYNCTFCNKSFSCSSNVTVHERAHTGEKPYKCKLCNKSFANSCNLSLHQRIHTGEKPFKCKLCNKSFSQSANLNSHEWTHRPTGEKPYKCTFCMKSFTQASNMARHERTHRLTGEKPYLFFTLL